MSQFVHLHVHTQYSVLDGMSNISALFAKARADGQTAIAITDHGNMFGVKEFLKVAKKYPDIKPIVGCEVYVNPEGRHVKRGKEDQGASHLILLAKNMQGYHNLVKLVSMGYVEGMYYKPKIDHELLELYHEGLIACSACLAGEVPKAIQQREVRRAEEVMLWHRQLFGDDYYVELQRHETADPNADRTVYPLQREVGETLVELARRHGIKLIASNDVHFVNADDAEAHDRLICLNTGADFDSPTRMRYTKQEWLKTQGEMAAVFADLPEVLANTLEVAEKVEVYDIDRKPIMPHFPLPDGFADADAYLRHLAYAGAEKRYSELSDALKERLDFELQTMRTMGFPDYFLIVQDFIAAARRMGVAVGPGRGSAAGSVVAYCLGITDIDPLKYNLLFERFLNPDRISMPDIDIDFDDDGRARVLKYVEEKYGKDHVSHVVTFGTMATRSAIKDVARVQKLPLQESDRLSKSIPTRWDRKDGEGNPLPINITTCMEHVPEIKQAVESGDEQVMETMKYAEKLEGSIRNTGVHACAIIIGRDNLMEHIPVSIAKDKETGEDMWVSQYEGSCIEDVGMLKMDFLGLKTLSILRDAVENIKLAHDKDIVLEDIPMEDLATFELFSRGDTVGTFQFESDGMRKWLRELRPSRFEDLIAMNALYRPGPMDYIPDFIARRHGRTQIVYDLPEMKEYLEDTYGVTVYQEQVMLLSQKLAGFTKGEADTLRKAMGKKIFKVLAEMKPKFIAQASAKGHSEEVLEKIWKDWESFAEYAFNKSHSTCYAWLGYQTAYLKANYPAEYMAAVLSRNLDNIDEISKFMDECRRMEIEVLPPDVNESYRKFTVNKKGNIRFGMAAIKGVGAAAVDSIVEERRARGTFAGIFDFVERVSLLTVNRKTVEALALSGAFDDFREIKRHHFFARNSKDEVFLDSLLRYGNKLQADKQLTANSLFGEQHAQSVTKPEIPAGAEEWNMNELLKKEKDLVGMYLSAHPLDIHKFELAHFTNHSLSDIPELMESAAASVAVQRKIVRVAGSITTLQQGVSQRSGKPYLRFTVEDYNGSYQFALFGKDYENFHTYIALNHVLLFTCKFDKRFRAPDDKRPDEWELKIQTIHYLAHVRDELARNIHLTLPVTTLTEPFVERLQQTVAGNQGKVELFVKLLAPADEQVDKLSVELFSRTFRVALTPPLLDFLAAEQVKYRLNV